LAIMTTHCMRACVWVQGLVVVAAAEAELQDWVPARRVADTAGCAAAAAVPANGGGYYNAMISPFSLTAVRAVMWAPPSLPPERRALAPADQACLFRAMINGAGFSCHFALLVRTVNASKLPYILRF
jgi:hypothetical protein